jgi:hypothetical protein
MDTKQRETRCHVSQIARAVPKAILSNRAAFIDVSPQKAIHSQIGPATPVINQMTDNVVSQQRRRKQRKTAHEH